MLVFILKMALPNILAVSPAFFDIFGLITFSLLIALAVWELRTKKQTPNWIGYSILTIAILGLIVDGFNVIKEYLI
jgi:hypothetical protein